MKAMSWLLEAVFLSDMLGFHQIMTEDAAPDSVASDYMGIHETLLLFTGIKYFWETNTPSWHSALFVKDGPLSIRAQYSKLVNPIRRFLKLAHKSRRKGLPHRPRKVRGVWDHFQLIGQYAPNSSYFVPDHKYIREEIQHRAG